MFYISGTNGWKLPLRLTLTTLETAQRTCPKRPEVGTCSAFQRKELRQMDLTSVSGKIQEGFNGWLGTHGKEGGGHQKSVQGHQSYVTGFPDSLPGQGGCRKVIVILSVSRKCHWKEACIYCGWLHRVMQKANMNS